MLPTVLDIASLRRLYESRRLTPVDLADAVARRMDEATDPAIFITPVDRDGLRCQAEELMARAPEPNALPLWGVPFAVKDNIDVAGLPTTAGCPAYEYRPRQDAFVVARLKAAGAIVTGKTNLDQFATGLNGTRSPYGVPRCVFDADYISGGSSSGSAVAVAAGLAAFSLGTDTAGSGRVPAAFNNLVGIKPTPGRISTSGLVPACRSIDCITIFSATVGDGVAIRRIAERFDEADPYSRLEPLIAVTAERPRIGVLRPDDRDFFEDSEAARLYEAAVARLAQIGAEAKPFDFAPFRETAALLYSGPWVAERLAALEAFLASNGDDIHPAVRSILESAKGFSAVDAFRGAYRLESLRRRTAATWREVDMLLLPTAPTTYTVEAMRKDPIRLNNNLGYYTNFANLLGLAAIAIPAGFRPNGLPFGVTLVAPGAFDDALAPLADRLHRAAAEGMGYDRTLTLPSAGDPGRIVEDRLPLAVVGAHLSGMPLNRHLIDLGGILLKTTTTAGDYRLFALPGTEPPKPGLVREPGFAGHGIEIEIWTLEPAAFARFVSAIPSPLGIGTIELLDGTTAQGFLCERHAIEGAEDVTTFRGWRAYSADKRLTPL